MRIAWALLACFAGAACAKSSTAAAPQPEPQGPARFVDALERVTDAVFCSDGPTEEVAFSEQTSAGFSADDVLEYAAGTHEERITWELDRSTDELDEIAVGPERGTKALSITVGPRSDIARFHVPTADVIGHGLVCKPWLEIDVHVVVRSEGGALLEGFDATLVSEKGSIAHIAATSDAGAPIAQGTLTVSRPKDPLTSVGLRFVFTQYGVTGALTGRWTESGFGDGLAHFGKAHCPPGLFALSLDDDIEGTSARELVRERGAHAGLTSTWEDGTAVKASISMALTDDTRVCGQEVDWGVDQVGFDLSVSGEVTLTTDDGRIAETMPGGISLPMGDPMRAGDFYLNGNAAWQPASSAPVELVPADDLDRFSGVSLDVNLNRDSTGLQGAIGLRGENPSSCVEPLADGACPQWESLGFADLRP